MNTPKEAVFNSSSSQLEVPMSSFLKVTFKKVVNNVILPNSDQKPVEMFIFIKKVKKRAALLQVSGCRFWQLSINP